MTQTPVADETLAAWTAEFQRRYGERLRAIVLYGSYTRGARDSLTDFYVLLDRYGEGPHPRWHGILNRVLPPNVYTLALADGARSKYALLPLAQFRKALEGDFHCYFWARFAQPATVVWVQDAATAAAIDDAFVAASTRFLDEVAPMVIGPATATTIWQRGLELTYRCELRAEAPSRAAELVERGLPALSARTAAWAELRNYSHSQDEYSGWQVGGAARWRRRRAWGKALSVARLLKASLTFNDGLDYLLWKIERHSGIYVAPSERQRRWPVLFAWPLWWQLYRLGAFR